MNEKRFGRLIGLLAVMSALNAGKSAADAGKDPASSDSDTSTTGIGIRAMMEGAGPAQSEIDKLNTIIFGGPCDCEICQAGRKAAGAAAETGTDGKVVDATVPTVSKVTSIEGEVAALVGLTPDMLEDQSDDLRTRLRLSTAEFVTNLRQAYAQKVEASPIHRTLADSVEVQALNAMEVALAGLDD